MRDHISLLNELIKWMNEILLETGELWKLNPCWSVIETMTNIYSNGDYYSPLFSLFRTQQQWKSVLSYTY